jgi:hypothetical protein
MTQDERAPIDLTDPRLEVVSADTAWTRTVAPGSACASA